MPRQFPVVSAVAVLIAVSAALTASVVASAAAPAALAASAPARADSAPHCITLPFGFDHESGRSTPAHLHGPRGQAASPARATVGNLHLLVILAEFSDVPAQITRSRFEDHLFGNTGATLRDYYLSASSGQLNVTGSVTSWVTLPETELFYSQGAGGVAAYPNNGQKMAEDAVTLAVASGVNLGNFDRDGDGFVDALLILHSGQGFEWASVAAATPQQNLAAINSHKWAMTKSDFGSGARAQEYFTCPELQIVRSSSYPNWHDTIATIGVFCHELGHILGLPDYYDTSTFDNRVGVWDVMDVGNWLADSSVDSLSAPGALPTYFSAWSRTFLGWIAPEELTPAEASGESVTEPFVLQSSSTGGKPLRLLANPGGVDWTAASPGSGEYFLAEVRTAVGYDAGIPSEGLMVYHVDEARSSNREAEAPFADGGLLVLVPEDNDFSLNTTGADPWPGGQTSFDAGSTPSSDLQSGLPSGVSITGIGAVVGGTVDLVATAPVVINLAGLPAIPYAQPHPWLVSAQSTVRLVLSGSTVAGSSTVHIYDGRGRLVRTLDAPSEFASDRIAVWDGRNNAGRPLPASMYFFRASGATGGAGRVLLLR